VLLGTQVNFTPTLIYSLLVDDKIDVPN